MRYYAYVTDSCWHDAERSGHQREVENLAAKVERDQSIATWDKFPPPCVKKSLGTFRLVAAEQMIGEDLVICFLAIMARGDARYEHFQNDPQAFVRPLAPSQVLLQSWLNERTETQRTILPAPSPTEYWGDRSGCIEDPFGHHWWISQRMQELTPEQLRKAADAFFAQAASA